MWSFFVYDNPSPQDLKPLADAYYQHDHSIAAMVRAMFSSPAFFSAQAYRARVKSPLEFLAGAVRALGLETNAVRAGERAQHHGPGAARSAECGGLAWRWRKRSVDVHSGVDYTYQLH